MFQTPALTCLRDVVAPLALLTLAACQQPQAAPARAQEQRIELPARAPVDVRRVPIGDAPVRGPADAKVTIVVFSDFQCPFCSRVETTLERLRQVYSADVRVVWKHRPLEFHDQAIPAALATEAAREQGRFWDMHARLMARQQELGPSLFEEEARALGLDLPRFRSALRATTTQQRVLADQALGDQLGVTGTPAFFINGRSFVGAQPFERFQAVVLEEMARAEKALQAGVSRAALYDTLTTP
jgi:protein-disulfide isomerase